MKNYNWMIALTILIGTHTFAGQQVGNGGAVVTGDCYGYGNRFPETLDIYEGKILRGLSVDLNVSPSLGVDAQVTAKLAIMINRLRRVDPARAELYQNRISEFPQETRFLENGATLNTIDDVGNIEQFLPPNCKIAQAAMQRTPLNPPLDKRYIIDGRLWNLMDADSRATLILHEVIYRDAIARGHTKSERTRFLVSYLASQEFEKISADAFSKLMIQNLMDSYNFEGMVGSRPGVFSYFEKRNDTHEEAIKFCLELGQNWIILQSDLLQFSAGVDQLLISPLGQFIQSELGLSPEKLFWTQYRASINGKMNLATFSRTYFRMNAFEAPLPSGIGTMCWRPRE